MKDPLFTGRRICLDQAATSFPKPPCVAKAVMEYIEEKEGVDAAIDLCLYVMRTQIFIDGNKRAAVLFANHYLISQGLGLLVIHEKEVSGFKKLLIEYYEKNDDKKISKFLREKCWRKIG